MARRPAPAPEPAGNWTFLSNHGHVFLCLAHDPDARLRDVAVEVGVTERAVQRIVADLEEAGYLRRIRVGRRNSYEINPDQPLRHPVESHQAVRSLLALVQGKKKPAGRKTTGG
ncbi:MAG: winged helix-turn-helix transcriptional regulator [Acidobacteria bacterium]|nr:winged helix-turn-helix transcriptional regulator [Acidobacteriota bacterium]